MMPAFLIVLALAAFGVAIVLWATRRRPHARTAPPVEPVAEPEVVLQQPAADPFAGAPLPASAEFKDRRT